jgi:Na+-transporting NADH:ubiquinone oxidoreductase subunit NqrD
MKAVAYAPPVLLGVAAIVAAAMNVDAIPSAADGLAMGAGVGAVIGLWLAAVSKLFND